MGAMCAFNMTMTFYCHCFLSADPDLGAEEPWAPANRVGTRLAAKPCFRPLGGARRASGLGNDPADGTSQSTVVPRLCRQGQGAQKGRRKATREAKTMRMVGEASSPQPPAQSREQLSKQQGSHLRAKG